MRGLGFRGLGFRGLGFSFRVLTAGFTACGFGFGGWGCRKEAHMSALGNHGLQMSSVFLWWLSPVRLYSLYEILYPKRRI